MRIDTQLAVPLPGAKRALIGQVARLRSEAKRFIQGAGRLVVHVHRFRPQLVTGPDSRFGTPDAQAR